MLKQGIMNKLILACLLVICSTLYPQTKGGITQKDTPYLGVGDSILRNTDFSTPKVPFIYTGRYFRFTPNAPLKPVYYKADNATDYYVLWHIDNNGDSLFLPMIESQRKAFNKQ